MDTSRADNIIARTRPPAVGSGTGTNPDHIAGFDKFEEYGLGMYGGEEIGSHAL